ncbi:hypothetical protein E2C01_062613 [Portunus trituberculatus]|uniref:Uncharacterized protein n=1 Tax=Portunus trituberculatus TaxID=210409 RepID=A0A5B7HE60_PORTR|nr:hypothetical protein [Portunus trituberculatus]
MDVRISKEIIRPTKLNPILQNLPYAITRGNIEAETYMSEVNLMRCNKRNTTSYCALLEGALSTAFTLHAGKAVTRGRKSLNRSSSADGEQHAE